MNEQLFPTRSYDELPSLARIQFGELVAINLTTTTNPHTHGLHRYPAKFIPQIPRWAIRNFSQPGDVVLDPFAGSGTTAVEAVAAGRRGVSIDLDPLACLIGRAKIAHLDLQRMRSLADVVLKRSRRDPAHLVVPMDGVRNFEHWFSRGAWAALQAIHTSIINTPMQEEERAFLLVVFSSILRAVSNADDQTQKTYVSGTLAKSPPPVRPYFERRLSRALDALNELNQIRGTECSEVICASATDIPLDDNSVNLVVTSPPYLDSVDYMYNLMVEYFWVGPDVGIDSRQAFNVARAGSIGSKKPAARQDGLPNELKELIEEQSVPAYRRGAIGPYFNGMAEHFAEANRVLKPGGRYVLVIGNSRTQSGMLPLHDALVVLASAAGLHMEHAFGYRIRRHYMKFPRKGRGGIILMDWVITLRKGPGAEAAIRRLPLIDDQLPPDAVAN